MYSIDGLKFCLGFVSSCLSSDFQLDGVCEHHMYTVFNCLACHEIVLIGTAMKLYVLIGQSID